MADYLTFMRSHTGQNPRVRRLYYVCGTEDVLRMLVVRQLRLMVDVDRFNVLVLSAADTPESEIWATLNGYPLDPDAHRLLIVHEAHRLKRFDRLTDWLHDRGTKTTAIFTSPQDEWEAEEREVIMKSSSAYFVRCALPKDEEDRLKRCQDIITGWGGNIDRINAGILASRVGYDMTEAWAVMQKASLFPEANITVGAIETLAPRHVDDDVIWNLVACNRRGAIEAAMEAPPGDVATIMATLGTHVETLGRLNPYMTVKRPIREIANELDVNQQYVRMLLPYAKHYSREESVRRIMLLTNMDAAHRRGAREGLLEALIAAW